MKTSLRPEVAGGVDLLGPPPSSNGPDRFAGTVRAKNILEIPVAQIVRDPEQPREEFDEDELARLAASLKYHGQLQPIRVRWDQDRGKYIVIAGERRWRAAQVAGLATLTATVDDPDPERILEQQLVENALRLDLNPLEKANAYRRLMDARGWSQTELADRLNVHKASVSRSLALLDLPEPVQARVAEGSMSASVAAEIARVADPVEQEALAIQVAETGVTLRQLRADPPARSPRPARAKSTKAPAPVMQKAQARLEGGTLWIQYQDEGVGPGQSAPPDARSSGVGHPVSPHALRDMARPRAPSHRGRGAFCVDGRPSRVVPDGVAISRISTRPRARQPIESVDPPDETSVEKNYVGKVTAAWPRRSPSDRRRPGRPRGPSGPESSRFYGPGPSVVHDQDLRLARKGRTQALPNHIDHDRPDRRLSEGLSGRRRACRKRPIYQTTWVGPPFRLSNVKLTPTTKTTSLPLRHATTLRKQSVSVSPRLLQQHDLSGKNHEQQTTWWRRPRRHSAIYSQGLTNP